MSVQALVWVWDFSQSGGLDKLVLLGLANRHNLERKGCWPSLPAIARDCGISESTARRCLDNLVRIGELEIVVRQHEAGDRESNFYKFPKLELHREGGGVTLTPGVVPQRKHSGVTETPRGGVTLTPEPVSKPEPVKEPKEHRLKTWPDGFKLTAELFNFASRKNLEEIEEQWAAFQDYHKSKGSKFLDWNLAWHTWVRNALKWGRNGNAKRPESFGERNVRETTELCRRVGERAEKILHKVASGLPEPTNGSSVPDLFGVSGRS